MTSRIKKSMKRSSSGRLSCSLIDRKDLKVQDIIGSGFYADVKVGIWTFKNENKHVAIKCLKEEALKDLRNIIEEAPKMSELKNNHIIKFHGICIDKREVKLVTEYAKFGSLLKVMRDPAQKSFFCQYIRLKDFAVQISKGMKYLADNGFVHCNLAARNVLVVDTDLVRISDFGLSKALGQEDTITAGREFAAAWCAPEIFQQQKCTQKSDVYSFGVLLWEMMTFGEKPWKDIEDDKQVLAYRIRHPNANLERPEFCPKLMYEVMEVCWSPNFHDRPGFDEITSSLSKIEYLVGSTTLKATMANSKYLSFQSNSRITLLERLNNRTEWIAQNEDATVGVVRENVVNLKIIPKERSLSVRAQISKPFGLKKLPSCSWPILKENLKEMSLYEEDGKNGPENPPKAFNGSDISPGVLKVDEVSGVLDGPPITPRADLALSDSQPPENDRRSGCNASLIDASLIIVESLPLPAALLDVDKTNSVLTEIKENRSQTAERGQSSSEKETAPEMNANHADEYPKENGTLDGQEPPLIDFFTDAILTDAILPTASFNGHQGRIAHNEATCQLIDLTEDELPVRPTFGLQPPFQYRTPQGASMSDQQNSNKSIRDPIFPYGTKSNLGPAKHNTTPFSASKLPLEGCRSHDGRVHGQNPFKQDGEKSNGHHNQCKREQIYQVPFHIPIPDVIPYVDPERLRQPPPDSSPAYGGETDALISRMQKEFPDLSRDDCYARLVYYNHDEQRIIKILTVKSFTHIDEESAHDYLRQYDWDVQRAVNYILG